MIRVFQRKPPAAMTPQQLADRLSEMMKLCPNNGELQCLGPEEANRQAQRLQVVMSELWLVQRKVLDTIASQAAFREALFNSQRAAAIAN
jgi:hypothetical protein